MNVPGATRDSNVVRFAEFATACRYRSDANCLHPENDVRESGYADEGGCCLFGVCPLGRAMQPIRGSDDEDRQDYESAGLAGDEEGYMVVDAIAYLEMLKAHPTPALPHQGAEDAESPGVQP